MTREQIQRAICKADCFQWRVLGNLECEGPCKANEFQLEMRHGHAADNVLDLVATPQIGPNATLKAALAHLGSDISPTDGTERSTTKGEDELAPASPPHPSREQKGFAQ